MTEEEQKPPATVLDPDQENHHEEQGQEDKSSELMKVSSDFHGSPADSMAVDLGDVPTVEQAEAENEVPPEEEEAPKLEEPDRSRSFARAETLLRHLLHIPTFPRDPPGRLRPA